MVESYTEAAIYMISPVILVLNKKSKRQTTNTVTVFGALEECGNTGSKYTKS